MRQREYSVLGYSLMYFLRRRKIKYHMFKKRHIALLAIIAALIIAVPIMGMFAFAEPSEKQSGLQVLTLWQIDGFEGGKGSRAQYLKDKSLKLFENENIFVNVISLSSKAAAQNLKENYAPDMISCSPAFNAHLQYINTQDFIFKTWCFGSYCLLSLDPNDAFADVASQNTVVNAGKENLADVAAAFAGVAGAKEEQPTNAYLQLLNGKYKYLLGTQRDIYRLKTRGATFAVKQITQFNDLYQNICIFTRAQSRYETCKRFAEYITENNTDTGKIGLLSQSSAESEVEPVYLRQKQFDYTLKAFCGEDYLMSLSAAAKSNDLNKIKNLLK